MATVREKIIDAVIAGLTGISGVGLVVPPGLRSENDAESIGAVVRGGQYAIELQVGHDEPEGDISDTMGVERWRLPVGCYIHMPEPPPTVTPDPPQEPYRKSYHALASEIGAAIYALYRSPSVDPGRWEVDGVPQARATSPLGGGGVYIDPDLATNVTEHAFEISYAHTSGDPTEPR
jgi:hypothetical protein